jgi:HD-like signal output (HDOD) protein
MSQDILHKILDDHKELSSLPQVLAEVIAVSKDPDASASDLARVAMKDPGLTAKLLRVVNSPHYGPATEITTVKQAVVALGMRTVTAIALSNSIYGLINGLQTSIDRKRFWRHSLEVALASRMIALATGYEPAEEAFVSGLLHEIGLLVLEASFPQVFRDIWKQTEAGENLVSIEELYWGTNHARVGQFLLDQWGVPAVIGAAVGSHHNACIEGAKTAESRLNQIVNLANILSKFRAYNAPVAESRILADKRTISGNLDISHSTLAELERDLINEVVKESSYLEIEIGSVEEILQEANHLLYRQYLAVDSLLRENIELHKQIVIDQANQNPLRPMKMAIAALCQQIGDISGIIAAKSQLITAAVKRGDIIDEKGIAEIHYNSISAGVALIMEIQNKIVRLAEGHPVSLTTESYRVKLEEIAESEDRLPAAGKASVTA